MLPDMHTCHSLFRSTLPSQIPLRGAKHIVSKHLFRRRQNTLQREDTFTSIAYNFLINYASNLEDGP